MCLSQLALGSGCQHHTHMDWEEEMGTLRPWNPHMELYSHASGVVSNFTLYFKVSMQVPMKSSSNYIYFHAFLQTSSQEYNVKMYKVTQGHVGGSRCTQTSTQPFSHTCWGHDAHEKSVRKSENTFSKETNSINQMQLSYWNPLFKGVQTPSGLREQGKFPCVRLLNTKLNFSVLRVLHWFALC